MNNGSKGSKACSVCGSSMPHMPFGTDSCEWDPKWGRLAKDRAKTVEELVKETGDQAATIQRLESALSSLQAKHDRLEAALSASAARVKELEALMRRMIDASDKVSDENPDEVREEAREILSIKVGETKP